MSVRYGKRRKREMGLLPPLVSKRQRTKVQDTMKLDLTKDPSRFDDLRFRPFLVVNVFLRPAGNVRTEQRGWQENRLAIRHSEAPVIVDRINKKIMCGAEVIIDIFKDRVLKNRLQVDEEIDPKEFDQKILDHFKQKYSEVIEQGKNAWFGKYARA